MICSTKKVRVYVISTRHAQQGLCDHCGCFYDAFAACWDAKYTYGYPPGPIDTTYRPVLFHTPPFPGYPSGHAVMGGVMAELNSYFFPAYKSYFDKRAKDGAESRFQGGIHFRSDNDAGVVLGRKVGAAVVQKVKTDGADTSVK